MPSVRYAIHPKNVTHESIDGEVVAIALDTGLYYSMTGTAGKIWELIAANATNDAIVSVLTSSFEVSKEEAESDLKKFVARLEAEKLVFPTEAAAAAEIPHDPCSTKSRYSQPALERYEDMQDMLILDPIHDVSDAGWPFVKDGKQTSE